MVEVLVQEGNTVKNVCMVLHLNRADYYRKKACKVNARNTTILEERKRQKRIILENIQQIKSEHLFWGYRRVRAYLQYKKGIKLSFKYVYQLMKQNNLLVDVKRYKAKRRPQREKIRAEKQNTVWGTDMTKFYVDTVGWLYFVVVLDWYTKKIVGWDLSLRSKSEQWIDALTQAVEQELILGSREYELMLISDNGSQPTSTKYESTCYHLEIRHITTSYSNPKGNADTERFFRTFKEEVVWTNDFSKVEDAKTAVEYFINFYNNNYPHSALGYISPVDFIKQQNYQKVA